MMGPKAVFWGAAGLPIAQDYVATVAELVASLLLHISTSGKSSMEEKVSVPLHVEPRFILWKPLCCPQCSCALEHHLLLAAVMHPGRVCLMRCCMT